MPRVISKFRGYSSVGTTFLSPVRYDLDLARQDLVNQFNTRLGERIMLPKFGTIIWDLLFDPLDESLIKLIRDDVVRIINEDPRWRLISVDVSEGPNALDIRILVNYRPSDETITLPLTYDKGTKTE
jgi:phage baseplate assembly protein W